MVHHYFKKEGLPTDGRRAILHCRVLLYGTEHGCLPERVKLLIVDDSAAMRHCIRDLLLESDEKFECSDGRQAVRAFATHHPDWVLMDIEMNELDGLSAARQIMADWPDARIIFVTSHDRPGFREAAAQLKAQGYVLKDRLEDIHHIIARATGGQRPGPNQTP